MSVTVRKCAMLIPSRGGIPKHRLKSTLWRSTESESSKTVENRVKPRGVGLCRRIWSSLKLDGLSFRAKRGICSWLALPDEPAFRLPLYPIQRHRHLLNNLDLKSLQRRHSARMIRQQSNAP